MRLFLLSLLLLSQANATIGFLGDAQASAATTNPATTASQDTTGAKFLVVVGVGYSAPVCLVSGGGIAVTDNKSNTWAYTANFTAGNGNVCVFYTTAANPTVGTGHTFTLAAGIGGTYPTIFASWWSASLPVAIDGLHVGTSSSSGTTLQTGSKTPSQDGCLLITGLGDGASVMTRTIDSPFTVEATANNNSFSTGAWAYSIQTTATAANPTWTVGTSGVGRGVQIVSFKEVSAASFSPPRRTLIMQMLFDLFGWLA